MPIEQAVEAHVTNGHRLIAALEEEERKVLTQLLCKLLISLEEYFTQKKWPDALGFR